MKCNNRIDDTFLKLKIENKKALITFVTAGDPDIETTYNLVLAMEGAGANLIELGVPYSDPIAEGPVIQAANIRALKNDVRMDKLFELVSLLRRSTNIPLVFLLYVNTILQYGKDKFFEKCAESGIDGVIIPDLPFEESEEISEVSKIYAVRLIRLVAPTSKDRIEMIAQKAEGFLYCVSSLGVTGIRKNLDTLNTNFDEFYRAIDKSKNAPSAVGFGISSPAQVKQVKEYFDGVIVGSAIVKKVAEAKGCDEAVKSVSAFVKELREAIDG
jgi:tryptophan synthase alpha chain